MQPPPTTTLAYLPLLHPDQVRAVEPCANAASIFACASASTVRSCDSSPRPAFRLAIAFPSWKHSDLSGAPEVPRGSSCPVYVRSEHLSHGQEEA